jgi:hypothetical protein
MRTAWYASDLGSARPCRATYETYRYEDQPPLTPPAAFAWYADQGTPDPKAIEGMDRLGEKLARVGLELPAEFVTFYTHSRLQNALDEISITCCWTDLGEELVPSPAEDGAYLLRFLRDQQDCAIWYLHLRPGGEASIVFSYVDFEEYTPAELADCEPWETEILQCAPTFEEFAYRFWLESAIWRRLHGLTPEPLDKAMTAYLAHFQG